MHFLLQVNRAGVDVFASLCNQIEVERYVRREDKVDDPLLHFRRLLDDDRDAHLAVVSLHNGEVLEEDREWRLRVHVEGVVEPLVPCVVRECCEVHIEWLVPIRSGALGEAEGADLA